MQSQGKFTPYQKHPVQKESTSQQQQQQSQQQQPARLSFTYSYRTRKGRHINNPNKINQDSILVKQNIGKRDLHMIAVADGHGQQGHNVSQFVIKMLSKVVSEEVGKVTDEEEKRGKNSQSGEKKEKDVEKGGQYNQSSNNREEFPLELSTILPKVYDKIQNQLTCSQINSATSGSTLVNVILQKSQILCANVGDSRAILARQVDKKNWQLIYLSQDHKPQSQAEKKRVLKSGGHIHAFKGINGQSLGPLRVWLPNQNIQGLAMTRSFGDNISKSVGVTHKPQMIKVPLTNKDKFILVASDGVWQFIKNQQILQLIVPFYKQNKLQEACDQLLKLAYERWTKDDNSVVDDISFVLVFFGKVGGGVGGL